MYVVACREDSEMRKKELRLWWWDVKQRVKQSSLKDRRGRAGKMQLNSSHFDNQQWMEMGNNWRTGNQSWGRALAWRLLDLVQVAEVPRPLSLDLQEDEEEDDDESRTLSVSPPASCSWRSFCSRSAISGKIVINVFLCGAIGFVVL